MRLRVTAQTRMHERAGPRLQRADARVRARGRRAARACGMPPGASWVTSDWHL